MINKDREVDIVDISLSKTRRDSSSWKSYCQILDSNLSSALHQEHPTLKVARVSYPTYPVMYAFR